MPAKMPVCTNLPRIAAAVVRRPAVSRACVRATAARALSSTTPRAAATGSLLAFDEDVDMFRSVVSRFNADVVAPLVSKMDEEEKMAPEVIKAMFETGLMAVETPEELGGAGASFTAAVAIVEELARCDPAVSVLNDVHNTLLSTCVRKWGSDYIRETYLPQLATSKLGAFALSEPSAGSDAFALKTRARKLPDGDFVLTGGKMWITNGAEADIFVVFANAEPEQGYRGITAFVVEKDWGVKLVKKEHKLGIRASSTAVLALDEVHVPAKNILGHYGKGYKIAIECLNEGRIGIAAQMTGIAMGAFDRAVSYVTNDRKQFGQYVGEFQGMQFQIAQVATEIEAARLLLFNAARIKDNGGDFVQEAAMAKLYASQVAEHASSKAVEWMGGVGFTREESVEKFYRDAKIGSIYEGTSNIQLLTIAKNIQKKYASSSR
ncbi:acyl-CoA dehydrogenase/oxidase [Limtongia smithiae]|uniref:acyl-CoA dehydrogenase/oxidase n=1 Tax=Limtongia smithiae TaxID=1125753 RepID=UPI0034D01EAE